MPSKNDVVYFIGFVIKCQWVLTAVSIPLYFRNAGLKKIWKNFLIT